MVAKVVQQKQQKRREPSKNTRRRVFALKTRYNSNTSEFKIHNGMGNPKFQDEEFAHG